MKLQKVLLLATLAFQYSNSKTILPENKNFLYNYYCSKNNGRLCSFIKNELSGALKSISSIIELPSTVKFDAVVDNVSKFRNDTSREVFVTGVNTEFALIDSNDNPVKSPYPKSEEIIKKISAGKNYTDDDFILLLNNFKSDHDYLEHSNKDYKNYAIKEIMKGLRLLNKLSPPYDTVPQSGIPDVHKAMMAAMAGKGSSGQNSSQGGNPYQSGNGSTTGGNPKQSGSGYGSGSSSGYGSGSGYGSNSGKPPSNIVNSFEMRYIYPFIEDKDICNILERNRNETLLFGITNVMDQQCESRKADKLSTIIHWKDRLLSKGRPRKLSKKQYKRIVTIGDIHGDYQQLIKILRHAKIINKKNQWIAKKTMLVQIGDLIDRGDDTIKILDLIQSLKKQAPKKNSIVHLLIGNHELDNVQARHFFTSTKDIKSFGTLEDREKAFSINGKYGKLIRKEMDAALTIDDSLFVHAGLYPEYAKMGIDEINNHVHEILSTVPSFDELCEMKKNNKEHPLFADPLLNGDKSLVYNRNFSDLSENEICPEVEATLKITNTKRMIIGHTIHNYGEIVSRCHDQLIIIDIGIGSCFGHFFGYLEMLNDKNEIWFRYNN